IKIINNNDYFYFNGCERVDWLLRNILSEHVIEPLHQLGGTYSCNHPYVDVLFASLVYFIMLRINNNMKEKILCENFK
ncbi:unnamed protein product, partial [Rotaria sordida]